MPMKIRLMGLKLSSFKDTSQISIENFGFKPIRDDDVSSRNETSLHEGNDSCESVRSTANSITPDKRKNCSNQDVVNPKKCERLIDHYFKDPDIRERQAQTLSMDLKSVICPVCSKKLSFNSLSCLNKHVDQCLQKSSSGILKYFRNT
jgi:wobble nucleotide-excising tRNase